MVEATPVGDARRDTSGLKHSWSHHDADDADAADVVLMNKWAQAPLVTL